MVEKKFLNPIAKIVLCSLGMLIMGYFLFPALQSGSFDDRLTIVRGLVFLAFGVLLIRSIGEVRRG
jgi:hypothetical protein